MLTSYFKNKNNNGILPTGVPDFSQVITPPSELKEVNLPS
jgi:hypothetical protein